MGTRAFIGEDTLTKFISVPPKSLLPVGTRPSPEFLNNVTKFCQLFHIKSGLDHGGKCE